MREMVERKSVVVAILAVLASACGQAAEPPVAIPARATALAIAPDYAGTIWATSGSHVYRSHDGGHSWRGMAHTDGVGVAFLEKQVVLVDGLRVGVAGFGATRLAERRVARPIVAVASPYYRTNRLYGLDPSGRLWLSVRGGRRWARRKRMHVVHQAIDFRGVQQAMAAEGRHQRFGIGAHRIDDDVADRLLAEAAHSRSL